MDFPKIEARPGYGHCLRELTPDQARCYQRVAVSVGHIAALPLGGHDADTFGAIELVDEIAHLLRERVSTDREAVACLPGPIAQRFALRYADAMPMLRTAAGLPLDFLSCPEPSHGEEMFGAVQAARELSMRTYAAVIGQRLAVGASAVAGGWTPIQREWTVGETTCSLSGALADGPDGKLRCERGYARPGDVGSEPTSWLVVNVSESPFVQNTTVRLPGWLIEIMAWEPGFFEILGSRGEPGFFAAGSEIQEVHGSRAVQELFGPSAQMMMALHPDIARDLLGAGERVPGDRSVPIAAALDAVVMGGAAEARSALARIAQANVDAGGASDPAVQRWVLACLFVGALDAYRLLIAHVSDRFCEALWQQYLRLGELLGLPRTGAPRTYRELCAYFDAGVQGPEIGGDLRQRALETFLNIRVGAHLHPTFALDRVIHVGLLRPAVRERFGLRRGRIQVLAFQLAVAVLRRYRLRAPGLVRGRFADESSRSRAADRRRRV